MKVKKVLEVNEIENTTKLRLWEMPKEIQKRQVLCIKCVCQEVGESYPEMKLPTVS